MRNYGYRIVLAVVIAVVCAALVAKGNNDYAQYWVASHQVLTGHNPYSPTESLAAEGELGNAGPGATLIPPWGLTVLLPLGLMSCATSQKVWFAINFAVLLLSAEMAGRIYAPTIKPFRLWLLGCTFLPAMICLAVGQISTLALLSVLGFTYFAMREKWLAAGACLFLASVKPQLVYLLWPALLLWTLFAVRRRWRVLGSFFAIIGLASAVAIAVDHAVFAQYISMWFHEKNLVEVCPTMAGALRMMFGREHAWLQALPAACGLLWLLQYSRNMRRWDWVEATPLLIVVSLATAPYGWYFDQVVLWPAILRVLARRQRAAIAAYLVLNFFPAWLIVTHRTTFWFSWTAPAWLLFYLIAQKGIAHVSVPVEAERS